MVRISILAPLSVGACGMITGRGGRDKRVPFRLAAGGWPASLQRGGMARRLFVDNPAVITDPGVTWQQFERAMFNIHLGGTAKITWRGRQTAADQLLLDHVPLDGARIVEMGASDGSTAVDLIGRLGDRFASYLITDRFVRIEAVKYGGWTILFRDGLGVVVAGRRVVAWPQMAPWMAKALAPVLAAAARRPRSEILMLNPDARAILDRDPRVTWAEHDVFVPLAEPADVIKVGNLLRPVYFTDDQIRVALRAIHASLADSGHLLIADHLRESAGSLFRRTETGFAVVAVTDPRSEIHDLVAEYAGGPEID